MSDQSASSHLKVLFDAALQDYERQTGIALAKHPLAERLQECHSVESITTVLHEQTQAFNQFRGKEKLMKLLKNAASVLHKLSACAKLGEVIGVKFSPAEAIHSGLAVILSTIKGVKDSYDALVELLESIEHLLYRLDIYTKITPTVAITEILVKILVELFHTLALATKEVRQGKPKKFVKKLFGEKDIEAVLQRLNRLTQDEAKLTAAQILEVVHGLVQNMRVLTDDGKTSLDCVRNTLETMNQIASDMNKSKRDKLQRDVRKWLSPPDPWKNQNIARGSQYSGTAEWFVQGNTFSAWKASDPSSLLWIRGKPGAGKSVLWTSLPCGKLDSRR
ncbi:hypothetical protein V8E52_011451 [Russula decolorans]